MELFDGIPEVLDNCCFVFGESLVIIAHCRWKPINLAIYLASKIRNKFHCDVTLTMTDDDGCNQYEFFKGE